MKPPARPAEDRESIPKTRRGALLFGIASDVVIGVGISLLLGELWHSLILVPILVLGTCALHLGDRLPGHGPVIAAEFGQFAGPIACFTPVWLQQGGWAGLLVFFALSYFYIRIRFGSAQRAAVRSARWTQTRRRIARAAPVGERPTTLR